MKRAVVGIVVGLALWGAADARAVTFEVNLAGAGGDQSDFNLADTPNECDVLGNPGIQCTLRAAIQEANATAGGDIINFNIPGGGVHTITPATSYPVMTGVTELNGYTQPEASPNTQPFGKALDTELRVLIDGSTLPNFSHIFRFATGSSGSLVRGFAIADTNGTPVFNQSGVSLEVKGNFIGTDVTGLVADPGSEAIFSEGGGSLVVGGGDADRNVLLGDFAAVKSNSAVTVEGNYIGVAADGKTVLGNFLQPPISMTELDDSNIVIENVVAGSPLSAAEVSNSPEATLFSHNRVFGNAGLGFDLGGDGVTQNDDPEADGIQNFPVLTSAKRTNAGTRIKGKLTSLPNLEYTVELFEADGNTRQGKRFLLDVVVATNGDGDGKFKVTTPKPKAKRFVVGTATNPFVGASGNTSEFSKPRKVK